MYTRSWLVIKDESSKTFDVVRQDSNDNDFANRTYAMQRDGMNVQGLTLPVGGKHASKDSIGFAGYTREIGLYERLLKEHQAIVMKKANLWDELPD